MEKKAELAQAIARRHSEATGAPVHFVQVIIDENPQRVRYLGNVETNAHIWIRGDIRVGRSKEVRENLIRDITSDACRIAAVPQDEVWVYLCNLEPNDMIEYGEVLPEPGKEEEWFNNLSPKLKERLAKLGQIAKFTL